LQLLQSIILSTHQNCAPSRRLFSSGAFLRGPVTQALPTKTQLGSLDKALLAGSVRACFDTSLQTRSPYATLILTSSASGEKTSSPSSYIVFIPPDCTSPSTGVYFNKSPSRTPLPRHPAAASAPAAWQSPAKLESPLPRFRLSCPETLYRVRH